MALYCLEFVSDTTREQAMITAMTSRSREHARAVRPFLNHFILVVSGSGTASATSSTLLLPRTAFASFHTLKRSLERIKIDRSIQ